jgi:hypothetical protein
VFGGFTPAISMYLIHITGNRAIPGLWLTLAAGCGLIATLLARPPSAAAVRYRIGAASAPKAPARS